MSKVSILSQVLPEHVNSPYDAWQPSRCQDLQLWGQAEDLQHVLHHAAGSNFPGGFSQEHIRWALAVRLTQVSHFCRSPCTSAQHHSKARFPEQDNFAHRHA